MKPLSAADIVRIWELGRGMRPVEQALLALSAACPGSARDELVSLPIGRRDALLLRIREGIFGDSMRCFAMCPHCGEKAQFALNVQSLLMASPDGPFTHELSAGNLSIRFRLPDSGDQLAIDPSADVETARLELIERCVLAIGENGVPLAPDNAGDDAVELLGSGILRLDPGCELLLELTCAACGNRWQAVFDIVTFLRAEISAEARRLLLEVHALATAYGWSEADILSMSAARRRSYLEMIG
jgi:hypothetical protein